MCNSSSRYFRSRTKHEATGEITALITAFVTVMAAGGSGCVAAVIVVVVEQW
jgi:hypothetical protein